MMLHVYRDHTENTTWWVTALPIGPAAHAEIKKWCCATYGEPGKIWEDYLELGVVSFQDQKDLALFLLKWQ
jgi:hypothetical protein